MSPSIAKNNSMPFGTKPKRPLTPYNLFYRYKRSVILNASPRINGDQDKIRKIVNLMPGLENVSSLELNTLHPNEIHTICRDNIREKMKENLLPFEGKRLHRKTHGMMNFVEMGRMMCDQWKDVDSSIKAIFQELAEEGKRLYQRRLLERKTPKPHCAITNNKVNEPTPKTLKFTTQVSGQGNQSASIGGYSPLLHFANSSPRPSKYGELHVVTPVSSCPKFGSPLDFNRGNAVHVASSNCKEEEDEFCAFIDKNIHPIDNERVDLFDIQEYLPSTTMDIIDMDEMIDHCKLPLTCFCQSKYHYQI